MNSLVCTLASGSIPDKADSKDIANILATHLATHSYEQVEMHIVGRVSQRETSENLLPTIKVSVQQLRTNGVDILSMIDTTSERQESAVRTVSVASESMLALIKLFTLAEVPYTGTFTFKFRATYFLDGVRYKTQIFIQDCNTGVNSIIVRGVLKAVDFTKGSQLLQLFSCPDILEVKTSRDFPMMPKVKR